MNIGILTFHSQLNYGGVLQCWALKTVLEKDGHHVVVLDRWMKKKNSTLERGFYRARGPIKRLVFWVRQWLGIGNTSNWIRVRRTKEFIQKNLNLTPYHFLSWAEVPSSLDLDYLIVGSDQIWHSGDWGDPRVYLLEGAPSIPALAYAASFGMNTFPEYLSTNQKSPLFLKAKPIYQKGLARFSSISCREQEGVALCRELGFEATHVVDPTLLAFFDGQPHDDPPRKCLVCYFLKENIDHHIIDIKQFAQTQNCSVKIFMGAGWSLSYPLTTSKRTLWKIRLDQQLGRKNHVEIHDDAGPAEFFHAFKTASWVLSDSFHALMFSCINGCNVRILKPTNPQRSQMFSRITEFERFVEGPLTASSVSAALKSFADGENVIYKIEDIKKTQRASLTWLRNNLSLQVFPPEPSYKRES